MRTHATVQFSLIAFALVQLDGTRGTSKCVPKCTQADRNIVNQNPKTIICPYHHSLLMHVSPSTY